MKRINEVKSAILERVRTRFPYDTIQPRDGKQLLGDCFVLYEDVPTPCMLLWYNINGVAHIERENLM